MNRGSTSRPHGRSTGGVLTSSVSVISPAVRRNATSARSSKTPLRAKLARSTTYSHGIGLGPDVFMGVHPDRPVRGGANQANPVVTEIVCCVKAVPKGDKRANLGIKTIGPASVSLDLEPSAGVVGNRADLIVAQAGWIRGSVCKGRKHEDGQPSRCTARVVGSPVTSQLWSIRVRPTTSTRCTPFWNTRDRHRDRHSKWRS